MSTITLVMYSGTITFLHTRVRVLKKYLYSSTSTSTRVRLLHLWNVVVKKQLKSADLLSSKKELFAGFKWDSCLGVPSVWAVLGGQPTGHWLLWGRPWCSCEVCRCCHLYTWQNTTGTGCLASVHPEIKDVCSAHSFGISVCSFSKCNKHYMYQASKSNYTTHLLKLSQFSASHSDCALKWTQLHKSRLLFYAFH